MSGTMISIRASDGAGAFDAFLALPASGSGPGLVLCQEIFGVNAVMRDVAARYAEEGYVVLVPDLFWRLEPHVDLEYSEADFKRAFGFFERFDVDLGVSDIGATIAALRAHPACTGGVGVLGYCLGGKLAYLAAARTDADAAVGYYGVGIEGALEESKFITCSLALHIAANDKFCPPEAQEAIVAALAGKPNVKTYVYPGADHAFAREGGDHYDASAAQMAATRTLAVFRKTLGPDYDLSAIADHHFALEFAARDPEATMATMVPEPYVNHVPTMTGGVGYDMLRRFYTHHFIFSNPADLAMIPVSRTVGVDRMVDEFILSFTHDREIDWLLPNVPPTGKKVEIPMLAVVAFRGDKLFNEHIYWDQASVLVQVGLLDPKLVPAVCGVEQARKLLDPALPSNGLMARWSASAAQPSEALA
jgi:carboxymethylenebutenolidase